MTLTDPRRRTREAHLQHTSVLGRVIDHDSKRRHEDHVIQHGIERPRGPGRIVRFAFTLLDRPGCDRLVLLDRPGCNRSSVLLDLSRSRFSIIW